MGVIIIGSLLWQQTEKRKNWRRQLAISKKKNIDLPIRYGRQSSKNWQKTYTMVFSNDINQAAMGKGFVVPIKNKIIKEKEFKQQLIALSKAEEIDDKRICRSWDTVCLIINPYIDNAKREQISTYWNNIVSETKQNLKVNQKEPDIEKFGEGDEERSINKNWDLTIDLKRQFSTELKNIDVLIATSNAVKLNNDINAYPTIKQIAKAIHENDCYLYFLSNTHNSIRTFQDRQIAKLLKRKYKISLKEKWKKLLNESRCNTKLLPITNAHTA